jgi:hypothetical protein
MGIKMEWTVPKHYAHGLKPNCCNDESRDGGYNTNIGAKRQWKF